MPTRGADGRTVLTLALRHLVVRRARALVLLAGFAIGAGVMMVLLSIGEAMLVQSRDVALVGGGDVTVLPEGADFEGLRTGSLSGLFYGIDRARFLQRQMLGGPRLASAVAAASPVIEQKLLYLHRGDELVPLRAGGEIPGAAREVGAGLKVIAGTWEDGPGDLAFRAPTPEQLYHELDRFHSPPDDSTWAEWHYFNVAPAADEYWYITFMTRGGAGGGGQLLITRHRPGRPPAAFQATVPAGQVRIDTASADLQLGPHRVRQRNGVYRVTGEATGSSGSVTVDLEVTPERGAYFPPIELRSGDFVSGYVVPAVRGTASGTICESGACRRYAAVPAYHDHNWGIWRETSWEWGQARGDSITALYGGVLTSDTVASTSPFFLALVDGSGVRQVLRFREVEYQGRRPVAGAADTWAPERFVIRASSGADAVVLTVAVIRAQATRTALGSDRRFFLQMRGAFSLRGELAGAPVADSGLGFFETFTPESR